MRSPPVRHGWPWKRCSPEPARTPASSAGPSSDTVWTQAPVVGGQVEALGELGVDAGARDAEVGVPDLAGAAQLAHGRFTVSTGTAKPTPVPAPDCVRIWELMPSTSPSSVEQRPARVALVDRRVRLHRPDGGEAR
jgi:hypothetical protein